VTTEADVPKEKRLNPFAFPSETNARFTLLVASALMLTFDIGLGIGLGTGVVRAPEWNTAFAWFMLPCGWTLSVFILAALIYRGHAGRIRRAENLRSISTSEDPKFADATQQLVNLTGISPAPGFEVARGSKSVDGQVFGFRNQYTLRLSGRLRLLLRQNPASFKAIVLHELGHIANADVTRAYFAQSILMTFGILVVIPLLVYVAFNFIDAFIQLISSGLDTPLWVRFYTKVLPTVFLLFLQILGTLAIVAAIRGSLLRVRELYADWRAALWGAGESIADILRGNTSEQNTTRWARIWQLHPSAKERLDVLQNPERLFQISNELPFFIGALLGFMLHALSYLILSLFLFILASGGGGLQVFIAVMDKVSDAFSPWFATLDPQTNEILFYIFIIPIILILVAMAIASIAAIFGLGFGLVYFVASTLGLEVHRESMVSLTKGQRDFSTYFGFWRPAALVAIGSLLGNSLVPYGYLGTLPEWSRSHGVGIALMVVILAVANTFVIWLWMIFTRFFGKHILGSHLSKSHPHGARRFLTIISSGLLLVLYTPLAIGIFAIDSLASGQSSITIAPWVGIILSISVGATLMYGLTFSVTWVFMKAYQLIRRPLCPACRKITKKRYAVGEVCEHCGKDLAPWLFVSALPTPNSV
jgi:Zn-dependent protease with chaperone function/ribosomal protein L37AE/L43A